MGRLYRASAAGARIQLGFEGRIAQHGGMRHFFTGQVIKTELLVEWLGQHGIEARQEWVDPSLPDDGDLSREARVLVDEKDYDRAHQLFFADREDEI